MGGSFQRKLQCCGNGFFHIEHAVCPECYVDSHRIFATQRRFPGRFVMQIQMDQIQRLCANALQITGFLCHKSQPDANSALNRREANQIILADDIDQKHESLNRALVGKLANRLAQTFLQPGRQKKLSEHLVHAMVAALNDSNDQRVADRNAF